MLHWGLCCLSAWLPLSLGRKGPPSAQLLSLTPSPRALKRGLKAAPPEKLLSQAALFRAAHVQHAMWVEESCCSWMLAYGQAHDR